MSRVLPFSALVVAAALVAVPAVASDPYLGSLTDDDVKNAPAQRYAAMSRDEALAELKKRGAAFDEVPSSDAPGVVAPIRLGGRLNGVSFHGMVKPSARATSPFEILDARLALSLFDFASHLDKHGIDEVTHFSMYRPGAKPKAAAKKLAENDAADTTAGETLRGTTAAKGAKTLRRPLQVAPAHDHGLSRHPAALAIDAASFKKKNGETLDVLRDFDGKIGDKTCGEGAPAPESGAAKELRALVCDAMKDHLFTYVLTPNFNAAHKNHFHMEVKAGVKWFLVH